MKQLLLSFLIASMSQFVFSQCDSLIGINSANPTCTGLSNGSVTFLSLSGQPISFVITNTNNVQVNITGTNTANSLPAGWYFATGEFGPGCIDVDSVLLENPGILDVDVTITQPSGPNACDGSIVVDTVYNAQGDYMQIFYNWSNGTIYQDSIGGLCTDMYTLSISDDNGCTNLFQYSIGGAGFEDYLNEFIQVIVNSEFKQISIENALNEDILNFTIYNMSGQIIQTNSIGGGLNNVSFNSNKGTYIYSIETKNTIYKTGRFVF